MIALVRLAVAASLLLCQGSAAELGEDPDSSKSRPQISYVLEPFEGEAATAVLHDILHNSPFLSVTTTTHDVLFGHEALCVEYFRNNAGGKEGDPFSISSSKHNWRSGRVHNVHGATHVSVWYKHQLGGLDDCSAQLYNDTVLVQAAFVLLDKDGESWKYRHAFDLENTNKWYEVKLPLTDPMQWTLVSGTFAGNRQLDLHQIVGWRFEFQVVATVGGEQEVSTRQQDVDSSIGTLFLDQIAFWGGGDLLGALFYSASWEEANQNHDMVPIYQDSSLSRNLTREIMGGGKLEVNYTLQKREAWGGFIQYQHIAPARAYYNLSTADGISMDCMVLAPASVSGRAHFRIILLDTSDCVEECSEYNGHNLENYYTFHHILDNVINSNSTLMDEIRGDDDHNSPFWRTGWYGALGNNLLDKDKIKGFKIELSLNSQGEIDSIVRGGIRLSDLRAVVGYNETTVLDLDFAPEPNLEFLPKRATEFKRVEFVSVRRCRETCDANPGCVYGMSESDGDCFLASYVLPEHVKLRNNGFIKKRVEVFWKNTDVARGAFCDLCECRENEKIIDCQGKNLTVTPKAFDDERWAPMVLDLRDNPQLVLMLPEALKELPTLREVRLPNNLAYIAPSSLRGLSQLQNVVFEENLIRGRGLMGSAMNFITEPSGLFSDVCCRPGERVAVLGSGGLSFCELIEDSPGIDAIHEQFVRYFHTRGFSQKLSPSSPFMSEAAESAAKCAQYCEIQNDCRYFAYDNRYTNTEPRCWLHTKAGNRTRLDSFSGHFADPELETPGWTSGRVSKTRRVVDDARVIFEPSTTLLADTANNHTTKFYVSLGSMPLRGAVWIEPQVASMASTDNEVELAFSPSRVVLYDNETVATFDVFVMNAANLSGDTTVAITNAIEACDAAFSPSTRVEVAHDIILDVVVPHRRSDDGIAMPILLTSALSIAVFAAISLFYVDRKRRRAESMWLVKPAELKFKDPPRVLGRGTFGYVLLAEYRGTQVAVKRVIPTRSKKTIEADQQVKTFSPFDGSREYDIDSYHVRCSGEGVLDVEMGKSSRNNWRKRGLVKPTRSVGRPSSRSPGWYESRTRHWEMAFVPRRDDYSSLNANFIKEMRQLSRLRHPCITTVMGAVIGKTVEPMLVMEYMDQGSLYDLLHNETMIINGEHILPILRDIAQGLRFLHAATPQVIHGDLKAMNILVDSKFRAKVADFGLSQKRRLGATGTPYWMAPELLRGESGNTPQSDVYSFGMILYELYSREDPYEGEAFSEVLRHVADPVINRRPECPAFCPQDIQSLVAQCFEDEPAARPSIEEIDVRLRDLDVTEVEPSASNRRRPYRRRSIGLMNDVFPAHIAEALRQGKKVEPEAREMVTIFFSDIVGFTAISSKLDPLKISDMLDRLYQRFDSLSRKHDIFKVETIGDSWMGVTNLIKDQSDHVKRIVDFSLDALTASTETMVDVDDPSKGSIQIRVGFHSGPVVGRVVGTRNPRYCLFGDTVNTASRMESHSKPGRIHCSKASADLLQTQDPAAKITSRGAIEIKGKGLMQTSWINDVSALSIVSEEEAPTFATV